MTKKPDLPKYCYARGSKVWVRYKNEDGKWVNKSTPYRVEQRELVRRYVDALLRGVERKAENGKAGPNTIAEYARKWCDEREARELDCAKADRQRLEDYVLPEIGHIALDQLRPRHVRDLIFKLRNNEHGGFKNIVTLAPRTVHHIFNTLHALFESAMVDELVWGENPVRVKPGVLPKKVDGDPEWRVQATFSTREIVMLVSSPLIPVERRVQYALKALAGMRHGEMAALCWRHIDRLVEPLWRIQIAQAWSTTKKKIKRTKNEETRTVPVHPALQSILTAWRETHWKRIYGRDPEENDFVVPARTGRCVDGADAVAAMKRDLEALELRTEAGSRRNRNGHDLRGWFKTQTIEDGADSLLIGRTTHAPPKSVEAGYQRFSWTALCREVAKLRFELDGDPLQLVTTSLHAETKAENRWRKEVTPKGLEPVSLVDRDAYRRRVLDERRQAVRRRADNSGRDGRNEPVPVATTLAAMLERAALAGDLPRILQIASHLRRT